MKIRKTVAGIALAGTMLMAGSAASAETAPPPRPAPSVECVAAVKKLAAQHQTAARMRQAAADLLRLRAIAVRHHRPDAFKAIDARLARLKAEGAKLRTAIEAQRAVVKAACAPSSAAAA